MPVPITPLIMTATELLISLIRAGKEAKEMNAREFEAIRAKINAEFDSFPMWDDL